jgi:HAE1 family hydrophobic/amphiphilic exporter-1
MEVTPFGQDSDSDAIEFSVAFESPFTLEEARAEIEIYERFLESKRADWGFDHWSSRYDESGADLGIYYDERLSKSDFERVEKALTKETPRPSGHELRFYSENESDKKSDEVVAFTLLGPDPHELERLGERAIRLLETVPGLSQISTPLESAPDEIEVGVDRERAQKLGVSSQAVEASVAYALSGWPLSRFQDEGREIPLLIELDDGLTSGMPTLRDLEVLGMQGQVPLASIAQLTFGKGARSIARRDGKIGFTIEAKVDDPTRIVAASEAGLRALSELELPRGVSLDLTNSARVRMEEEFSELFRAFLLSLVLVFLLMAILFESLVLPFACMFTVPFAYMGGMWALFLSGRPMDSMGWIGFIILAGVVVNNGIVLIDRVHTLRREGMARSEAVLLGSRQRVRPVLMTALTTIVGLVPMILAEPPRNGFDYRALATITAGGLSVSTVLTLWIVPLTYTLIDDGWQAIKLAVLWGVRRSREPRQGLPDPAP